jgi:type 1 fimbria pilin
MKTFAIAGVVLAISACASDSSAPTDRFDGTWSGDAIVSASDTIHFVMGATQNGSAVAGNGNISEGGASEAITFNGTSSDPSVNLTIIAGSDALTYTATYVRSDSVVGTLTEGSASAGLSMKRQ